jgi:PTS system nitrogen regulatory IIA component
MRLTDILIPERITTSLNAATKEQALRALSELFVIDDPELLADGVFDVLLERERLASTGVGSGVAIPHGRLPTIERLRAAVAVSPSGIPFDAIDGAPVRIIIGVLAPLHHTGDHLRVLARVSRLLRSGMVRERLLAAASPEDAYAIVAAADAL